jgi:acetyl-CoA C-acetyltransferase
MSNVIVSFSRTPIGSFLGSLSSISSPNLGAVAIKGAISKINLDPKLVNQVIMGNVLSAGVGQAPARQAAIYAGLPNSVQCLTINKMCGSGLQSIMLADQLIKNDSDKIIIAGGMENMSQTPHYLLNSRTGTKLGEGKLVDGMIIDGLWDVYNNKHMGNCAEMCAEKYSISREEQDDFAIRSYENSQTSISNGTFDKEIVSVELNSKKETVVVDKDEEPGRVSFEKLRTLRSVFQKDGTVTAGNASTINDGAAVCLIMSEKRAIELGIKSIAHIVDYVSYSHEPEWFTTAPIFSIKKLLKKQNLQINNIDLFEINEAFSVVALAAIKNLNLDIQKVNLYGGAVSLGHPIGASGARIICTLLNAMENKNKKMGISSICIGGGEASSMLVRRVEE